jgi:nicotinamide mononucleotide transporter
MSGLEIAAVAFGLLSVVFTVRQSIWCWPTGLINVALYVVVFREARLYSDMVLQAIYVPMQVYGWYYWLRKPHGQPDVPVQRITGRAAAAWFVVAVFGTAMDGWVMHRYFGAALPWWDATIVVLSLIAQYLLARKVLESWLIWIAVDILALGVYAARGLYLTTGLYAVFLVLATLGLVQWIRSYRKHRQEASATARGLEVVAG